MELTPISPEAKNLSFSQALELLKQRQKVSRTEWHLSPQRILYMRDETGNLFPAIDEYGNKVIDREYDGSNCYICIQFPDEQSKMTIPYIYMRNTQRQLVPYVPTQIDVMMEDWFVVEETKEDIEEALVKQACTTEHPNRLVQVLKRVVRFFAT